MIFPLAFVVCISLLNDLIADIKRHRDDAKTNKKACVILRRADELDAESGAERDAGFHGGKDVAVNLNKAFYDTIEASKKVSDSDPASSSASSASIAFQTVRQMDIRQGHFVLIQRREIVPADVVLFASSNPGGNVFIETSSVDGETNLKLRTCPHLPP